jgi:hypothetical protein
MSNYAGWTADELKGFLRALQKARFSGALRVEFRDREVEYKSDAEMQAAENRIIDLIASTGRSTVRVAGFSRGDW